MGIGGVLPSACGSPCVDSLTHATVTGFFSFLFLLPLLIPGGPPCMYVHIAVAGSGDGQKLQLEAEASIFQRIQYVDIFSLW